MRYPTINKYYNEAWETLEIYFSTSYDYPNCDWLDLDSYYPTTKKDWKIIYRALLEVYAIGTRQGWLSTHVDGAGRIRFLVNHKEVNLS